MDMNNQAGLEAPPPALFVNEHVSLPENRVNLALFSLTHIPVIRAEVLDRLGLPSDSIVYPPSSEGGRRPDFVVVSPDNRVAGWIEIELGAENRRQIADYRAQWHQPIKSVVGPREAAADCDLCLEELAEFVTSLETELDLQQMKAAAIFTRLVSVALHPLNRDQTYKSPEEAITGRPCLQALSLHLDGRMRFGMPPITPGEVLVSTIHHKGWTLRVFSKVARARSVSLMWDTAIGAGRIRVPSHAKLIRCLPSAVEALGKYQELMRSLGANLGAISERESLSVEEDRLIQIVEPLSAVIARIAESYGESTIGGGTTSIRG